MRISCTDILALQNDFAIQKNMLADEITKLREYMFDFSDNTDIFEGESANRLRSYIHEVHGETLYAWSLLFVQMEAAIKKYLDAFNSNVDENQNAILNAEYLEYAKNEFTPVQTDCDYLHGEVQAFMGKYSEFLTCGTPDISGLKDGLETSKRFLSKNITAVEDFDASMATCFSEVDEILDAILLACKTNIEVNADTGDLDYPKNFLSNAAWFSVFSKAKEESNFYEDFKLPPELQAEIDAIVNDPHMSVTVKADAIVGVYEKYLLSLAAEDFERFNTNRNEAALGTALQGLGIDMNAVVCAMGDDLLRATGTNEDAIAEMYRLAPLAPPIHSAAAGFVRFVDLVYTGGPMDLKSRPVSAEYDWSIWARRWTAGDPRFVEEDNPDGFRPDYYGNFLFGYFGNGYFYGNQELLLEGAGLAQGLSDNDLKKWMEANRAEGNYGDNFGDSIMIKDGFAAYTARQPE